MRPQRRRIVIAAAVGVVLFVVFEVIAAIVPGSPWWLHLLAAAGLAFFGGIAAIGWIRGTRD
jgi:membrane protease YdiL (CAAX protease family)